MLHRRHFAMLPAAALASFALPAAWTTAFGQPAGKAVRIVVPLPAGGSSDALARLLADKLRTRYAPTIIVDNRVGGGGRIGVEVARNSEADGSQLLFTPDFPFTLFPSIYKKLPYELKDFAPVASCGITSMAIAAGPGLPERIRTIDEFVQWAKANPKLAVYASPAAGSTPHFAGMMLGRAAQIELLHVAYKGGAPAIQDLLGGQIPVSVNPVGEVLQHVKAGKLRVLATTGAARSRFLPAVPTLVEAGFKDVVVQSWLGMFAPAGAPPAAAARLNAALMEVIRDEEVVAAFARIGFEPAEPASAAAFAALVRSDAEKWGVVVKATGFTAEE
jgi:tripartite-type tricarboxylate transporter receptor subunit TctC